MTKCKGIICKPPYHHSQGRAASTTKGLSKQQGPFALVMIPRSSSNIDPDNFWLTGIQVENTAAPLYSFNMADSALFTYTIL